MSSRSCYHQEFQESDPSQTAFQEDGYLILGFPRSGWISENPFTVLDIGNEKSFNYIHSPVYWPAYSSTASSLGNSITFPLRHHNVRRCKWHSTLSLTVLPNALITVCHVYVKCCIFNVFINFVNKQGNYNKAIVSINLYRNTMNCCKRLGT